MFKFSCFVIKETQVFQLTKLNGVEHVNCELLQGLTKENLPGILERKKCASTWQRKTAQVQSQAGRGPDTTQKEQRSE